jgi:hypothetical protein
MSHGHKVRRLRLVLQSVLLPIVGCFVPLAPFGQAGATTPNATNSITWLAGGDSYSSGEGLPHATGPCAQTPADTRSAAWSVVASEDLVGSDPKIGPPLLVACTGATTKDFSSAADSGGNPEWWPQLGRFDLVSFTFGGDDIGFTSIILHCITIGCPSDKDVRSKIRTLGSSYDTFLRNVALTTVNPGGNILVLGYPDLIELPKYWTKTAKAKGSCSGISPSGTNRLRGWAGDLNATIGSSVRKVNSLPADTRNHVHLTFLDVNSGSNTGVVTIARGNSELFEPSKGARHNLCSQSPWINTYSEIDTGSGSFHPKQLGQNAMGALAATVIKHLNWSSLTAVSHATPALAWGPPTHIDSNGAILGGVACASPTFCVAVDSQGNAFSYRGSSWSEPEAIDPNGEGLFRVACPATKLCIAIDHSGNALVFNGLYWSAPDQIDPNGTLNRISCPTTAFCMVVDDAGNAISYNDGVWSQPNSIDPNGTDDEALGLNNLAVSCASSTMCLAVDGGGNVLSYSGSNWSVPTSLDSTAGLLDISCTTSNFCVATDFAGSSLTFQNGAWSQPISITSHGSGISSDYGSTGYLLGSLFVACPVAKFCTAVDAAGDAITLQDGHWSPPVIIDAANSSLSGISCPSVSMCMAIDESGNALMGRAA